MRGGGRDPWLTFELAALQQGPGLLQREELLDRDEVVIHPGDLAIAWLSGGACAGDKG